jgi:hypothetical protein
MISCITRLLPYGGDEPAQLVYFALSDAIDSAGQKICSKAAMTFGVCCSRVERDRFVDFEALPLALA